MIVFKGISYIGYLRSTLIGNSSWYFERDEDTKAFAGYIYAETAENYICRLQMIFGVITDEYTSIIGYGLRFVSRAS